jgi:RND family efflux transporter MFP subunit
MRQQALITAIFGSLLLSGCARQEAKTIQNAAAPPVAATVIDLRAEPFTVTIPVTGTLVSSARVDVKAEIIGRVVRFDKEEGSPVSAGETVAWVNAENYELSLKQAQTGVIVAEAGLDRARLMEQHSRSEMERAQHLLQSGGITDKDLKAAELTERDASAQVQVAVAQLEQARATLAVASKHVRDAQIHSPVAGVIQKKFINKGAYVEAPTPVFTVVDNTRLELESPVASSDLAPIVPGQKVSFTVNSYPGVTFEGSVLDVNPAVEADTRSAKVRIRVPNPGGKLKAGMFAEGEIVTGVVAGAVIVPADAVYRDDRSSKSSYVFVVENGKAVKRAIRIGRERATRLEIAEGLRPGDRVIAEQNIEIAEGVRVAARR